MAAADARGAASERCGGSRTLSGEFGKIELVMALRNQGIRDIGVLAAMERVPRDLFVGPAYKAQAYADRSLPIECGQTISQPYVVAYMTEKLDVGPKMKVLEVGTGSGYQTAVLAHLCRRVYTIERFRALSRQAVRRFEDLKLNNIVAIAGDGARGWPEQAPFDRIIATAAARDVPLPLIDQLKIGGVLVMPVGDQNEEQHIVRLTRGEDAVTREVLLAVRFVPLVEGAARG